MSPLVIVFEKPRVLVFVVILVRLVFIKSILSAASCLTSSSCSSLSSRGPRNPYPAPSLALWFSNCMRPYLLGLTALLIIFWISRPSFWFMVLLNLKGDPLLLEFLGSSSLFMLFVSSRWTYLLSTCLLVLFFRCSSFSSSSLISVSNLSLILLSISCSLAGI